MHEEYDYEDFNTDPFEEFERQYDEVPRSNYPSRSYLILSVRTFGPGSDSSGWMEWSMGDDHKIFDAIGAARSEGHTLKDISVDGYQIHEAYEDPHPARDYHETQTPGQRWYDSYMQYVYKHRRR